MFMQLSCALPGVLCSNLVPVNGHNKGVTHQILSMLYFCILYPATKPQGRCKLLYTVIDML